jgi:hypothetical protein
VCWPGSILTTDTIVSPSKFLAAKRDVLRYTHNARRQNGEGHGNEEIGDQENWYEEKGD